MTDKAVTTDIQAALIRRILDNDAGRPISELGIEVGYSPTYARTALYSMINKPNFRRKLINAAKSYELAKLPKILKITNDALDEYSKEPRLAIEKPQFISQVRRDVGISNTVERDSQTPTVQIGTLNVLQTGLAGHYGALSDDPPGDGSEEPNNYIGDDDDK